MKPPPEKQEGDGGAVDDADHGDDARHGRAFPTCLSAETAVQMTKTTMATQSVAPMAWTAICIDSSPPSFRRRDWLPEPHARTYRVRLLCKLHASRLKRATPLMHRPLLRVGLLNLKIFDRARTNAGPLGKVFP